MDKNIKKDEEYFQGSENMERVHVQVGMEKKNWKNTYLHNTNGRDKSKIRRAISMGAICMEYHISKDELIDAVAFIVTKRNLNGFS